MSAILMAQICERCLEADRYTAGVYRDGPGQVLCDECLEARERDKAIWVGDYGRANDHEPRAWKRSGLWKG